MGLNTIGVGANVTPTVIETWFSHYVHRKPLHQKPTAHISYHVGLQLIRQFLEYASHHTVEDLQAFTSQWVPCPRWVRVEDFAIPEKQITSAVSHLTAQLTPSGISVVGGQNWWQWRPDDSPLKAEWIEMRRDYNMRRDSGEPCRRSMLYVHGGAYFFGSVDEHRYQMQRHARKLQARVLAPRYRLAPQFPFPCGLLDCLATYLYLLEAQPPETIVLAGDSAGAGMVVSLLVILRDQGLPLPAGAILLSPWVDLTHSFPSVAGGSKLDYVPPNGFWQKPSLAWPPPDSDEQIALETGRTFGSDGGHVATTDTYDLAVKRAHENEQHHVSAYTAGHEPQAAQATSTSRPTPQPPSIPQNLSLELDGKHVEIRDQIQMYATNAMLAHPLVSPVMQPSLGGLPPLMVLVGGGEMLRDEQVYLAHKAAAPTDYPPSDASLDASPDPASARADISRYPPTNVQLQVWDDLCHVAPTLSFTRPAKFTYRSVAQFGAWALARAQRRGIDILDDDAVSVISNSSSNSSTSDSAAKPVDPNPAAVGHAGDPLPRFTNHMIRQRVTRHGEIFPLDPPASLAGCAQPPSSIGVIKPGPVRKWLETQREYRTRYAKESHAVRSQRSIAARRHDTPCAGPAIRGETPPPTALAGRSEKLAGPGAMARRKRSRGLALWSGWGSRHDEETLEKEEQREGEGEQVETTQVAPTASAGSAPPAGEDEKAERDDTAGEMTRVTSPHSGRAGGRRHSSRSRVRTVSYEGQTADDDANVDGGGGNGEAPALAIAENSEIRPAIGNQAFPFKLARPPTGERNPSTMTLQGAPGTLDEAEAGEAHAAAAKETVVDGGEVLAVSERPEPPRRFVTASDGLDVVAKE